MMITELAKIMSEHRGEETDIRLVFMHAIPNQTFEELSLVYQHEDKSIHTLTVKPLKIYQLNDSESIMLVVKCIWSSKALQSALRTFTKSDEVLVFEPWTCFKTSTWTQEQITH